MAKKKVLNKKVSVSVTGKKKQKTLSDFEIKLILSFIKIIIKAIGFNQSVNGYVIIKRLSLLLSEDEWQALHSILDKHNEKI